MAEFRLERFKYTWKGEWATGTSYKRDDIVRVNGKSYVCVITHTASSSFRSDLYAILPNSNPPQPQPRWVVMTNGRQFIGDYQTGIDYNEGDIIRYDGVLWVCNTSHNSTGSPNESEYWDIFANNISFVGNWQSSYTYGPGAIVKYNGIVYKSKEAHQSQSTLEADASKWEVFYSGVEFKGDWASSTSYRKNDLVRYGGTLYRCTETHTSSGSALDTTKFDIEVHGNQFDGEWNPTTEYNEGDLVRHRGYIYYAVNNNAGSRPYTEDGSSDWELLSRAYKFAGDWSVDADYRTGDIVLRGGNLYTALKDVGEGGKDGSSADYLDADTWDLTVPGKAWKGTWAPGTTYSLNDTVTLYGTVYTCNFEHVSDLRNFPGDNGNGFEYWDILIQAGTPAGLTTKGDLLTYGPSRPLVGSGEEGGVLDDSTLGDTRVPVGEDGQLLSITEDLEVFWRNITEDAETVYVSTNGIDDINRGSFQNPFKTIRYAAEYVEDTYDALTPVIIRISTGKYEEIGPIIVPAGCAVHGDELRSTTVIANSPLASYQNDYQYVQDYLSHFQSIVGDIVLGQEVTPQAGNTEVQDYNFPELDDQGNTIINPVTGAPGNLFPVSNLTAANRIVSLITTYKDYIEFVVESGDTNPTMTGSNTLRANNIERNAADALLRNRKFIEAELIAYLKNTHPTVTFDEVKVRNDVWAFLRGIIRDNRYSGNYGTLTAARRYANAVTGSTRDNLFLMRDTTGLRDLTTGGLQGILNPPGVFDLYQKPTGGACVSLDSGWGPEDNRCWINLRSPYIQGVTNTGIGCVGMKVDGSLHNGGNKSMTANDFTQVLSDGIGAWVSNNARVELVSVFTYYCQIGYFAEDGGIIRATNGNNSYGRYGSIADGVDETEVPQPANVNNRNNQAQVKSAFAGGTDDRIFLFEYTNAGESYTQADATIVGAGANADVEYTDFRDGALFELRITNETDSTAEGGVGYLARQGTAQELLSASSSIILGQNDVTQFLEEIDGMRIIITDGKGVGQYGYITAFDIVTKTVSVNRESDDQPGWDHIIPGTPIETSLDLTTRYRIEPRIEVSAPPFSTEAYDLFVNRTYVDATFGYVTRTYNNVSGSGSIDWVDDANNPVTVNTSVSPVAVQFNASFASNPSVPFTIKGKTSLTTATITAITANTGSVIEVDVSANGTSFIEDEEIEIILVSGTGETFDDAPVAAVFNVIKSGETYTPTLVTAGSGYAVNDTIKILGTSLGGTTPANDLKITITSVSEDSTNGILTFTSSGTAGETKFVSLTNSEYSRYSSNGTDWTETSLPFTGNYNSIVAGNGRFIAIASNENRISYSLTGESWTSVNLPLSATWSDGTYGNGKFVIVASDNDIVVSSADGQTWSTGSIPNDTDGGGDSTTSQWSYVTYGAGKYVAVSVNDLASATSSDGVNWTRHDSVTPDFGAETIVSIAYGNNRFIIVTDSGSTAYSFNGITWYEGGTVPGLLTFSTIKYGQGVFMVIGNDGGNVTNSIATSEDGIIWTARETTTSQRWSAIAYGNVGSYSKFVLLANAASTNGIEHVTVGARAKLRADVVQGKFESVKIWDPGSGYYNADPTVTITDPNPTVVLTYDIRRGNNVLSQPDFINRGAGYRTTTSTITISGNGYADIIPNAGYITFSGVETVPGPGAQIEISGIEDPDALVPGALQIFSAIEIEDLGDDGSDNNTKNIRVRVSPTLKTEYNIAHGTSITIRERYSQCRITGHDFLDIGTGNFEDTNYPSIYSSGNYFTASPENEVYEANNGRVYYTSTDQDGNFRTGELFSVQQSTGTVTISADFFDLDGLSELALGGVRLGGTGAVVQEFSTDPTFSADSNNVVPTQRAIATFLANRLSVGGENLEVNRLGAGRVVLGGSDNEIDNSTGQYVFINVPISFDGTFEKAIPNSASTVTRQVNVSGTIISQMLFLKGIDETMQ